MSAIPITANLPQFHQGAEFEYGPLTFTIAANLPDPNDWTVFKLVIHPKTGSDVESDPNDAVIPPAITGTGPWTVVAYFPMVTGDDDNPGTASLGANQHDHRIIFETATGRDVLVKGLVTVLPMHQAEW